MSWRETYGIGTRPRNSPNRIHRTASIGRGAGLVAGCPRRWRPSALTAHVRSLFRSGTRAAYPLQVVAGPRFELATEGASVRWWGGPSGPRRGRAKSPPANCGPRILSWRRLQCRQRGVPEDEVFGNASLAARCQVERDGDLKRRSVGRQSLSESSLLGCAGPQPPKSTGLTFEVDVV